MALFVVKKTISVGVAELMKNVYHFDNQYYKYTFYSLGNRIGNF